MTGKAKVSVGPRAPRPSTYLGLRGTVANSTFFLPHRVARAAFHRERPFLQRSGVCVKRVEGRGGKRTRACDGATVSQNKERRKTRRTKKNGRVRGWTDRTVLLKRHLLVSACPPCGKCGNATRTLPLPFFFVVKLDHGERRREELLKARLLRRRRCKT